VPDERRQAGSAAVEFALVLPLLLVVGLGLVQVGLLLDDRLLVEEAARAAARQASIDADPASVLAAAWGAAPSLGLSPGDVHVRRAGSLGEPVSVDITYSAPVRVPFVSWLLGRRVQMHATTTDRQEFG
jgi:hypothetical protein